MAGSLGQEISEALSNITTLIIKTESASERAKLTQQQADLAGQLQDFVDKVVDASLPEYKKATEALNEANSQAQKAKAKLDQVAATITKVAGAIDKLAALAAKLAP